MADIKQIKINDVIYDIVATVPAANGDTLGTVKSGGDVNISSGVISVKGNTPVTEVISYPVLLTKEENSKTYDIGNHFYLPFEYEINPTKIVYGEMRSGDFIDPTLDIADIEVIDAENYIHAFVLGPEIIGDITDDYNFTIDVIHFYQHGTTIEYTANEKGEIIFGSGNTIDVNEIRFSEGNLIIPASNGNLNEQPHFLIDIYLEWSCFRRTTQTNVSADIFDLYTDQFHVYASINNNYHYPGLDDIISLEGTLKITYNIGSDLRTESTTPYFHSLAANNLKPVTGDAIKPIADAEYNLGSTDKRWDNIYARNFMGTAYKASNDEAGNDIVKTYATKDEVKQVVTGGINIEAEAGPNIDENGTPSITTSKSTDASGITTHTLTFDYLKGQKGEPGTSAKITGVTAEVDSNSGTPSVTVTSDGSESARAFHFKFKNLKGQKGDPGKTPVRGEDYWTEDDKAVIKKYVDDAILNGEW